MRISDWSSDVCSSDLRIFRPPLQGRAARLASLLASRSGWGPSALRKADGPHPTPPLKGRGLKDRKFPPHGLATRRRDTELKARIHNKGDCHDDRPSSPALCPGRTCAPYLGDRQSVG